MNINKSEASLSYNLNLNAIAHSIIALQKDSGEIPWFKNGKTDPWDVVESAMGLNIAGFFGESELAFNWMLENQNPDGSWYSSYMDGKPDDRTCETNMSSYIAAGVFHTWLIRKKTEFLEKMWNCLEKGINFALELQTQTGEIYWAKSPEGKVDQMALLTGSSSVYLSLKSGIAIASVLGKKVKSWETAFHLLGNSIRNNMHNYNITKSRFSMYWFYPILSGAITGIAGDERIKKYWKKYVIHGQGVKCVSDQQWVTIAETSELVISLAGMGNRKLAGIVFSWIQDRVYDDCSFWCGYTFPDMVIWPEDKISWTNAAVLMAADALYSLTPGSKLFLHNSWNGFNFKG